ncbi:hypothetical protein Hanom_Chr12g01068321 [Helianthus anomalus]
MIIIIIIIILNLGLTIKLKGLYFRRENRILDSLIDCHVSHIALLYYMYRLGYNNDALSFIKIIFNMM